MWKETHHAQLSVSLTALLLEFCAFLSTKKKIEYFPYISQNPKTSNEISCKKMTEINFENEILNGKNKNSVRCQFCNSLILLKQQGIYLQQDEEINLPTIHAKNTKDPSNIETEPIKDFWTVGDMFQFENIGFSNTVDNLKYLTCADCDMGPVGYQDLGSNKMCYVSLSRVKHDN